jgi:hypothetical protein
MRANPRTGGVVHGYSEQLDLDFHTAAFEELLRVAGEVRVFPLLGLDRQRSRHVSPVGEHLTRAGFVVEVVAVEYEFQRADDHAGSRMLRSGEANLVETTRGRGRMGQ